MNKFINVLSVILVLSSSVFLSNANAAKIANTVKDTNPTEMLIKLAESNPTLVDRLNDIALTDEKLLTQILKMAESDPVKLDGLLDLEERNSDMFWMIANIYNVQAPKTLKSAEDLPMSSFGVIKDSGGIIRN
jgi:hypothetical protein